MSRIEDYTTESVSTVSWRRQFLFQGCFLFRAENSQIGKANRILFERHGAFHAAFDGEEPKFVELRYVAFEAIWGSLEQRIHVRTQSFSLVDPFLGGSVSAPLRNFQQACGLCEDISRQRKRVKKKPGYSPSDDSSSHSSCRFVRNFLPLDRKDAVSQTTRKFSDFFTST